MGHAGAGSKAGGEPDLIAGFLDRAPLRSLADYQRLINLQVTMLGARMLGKEEMSRVWENAMENIFERRTERYERVVSSGE